MTTHLHEPPGECGCSLELVWDDNLDATAVTDQGTPIRVGPAANLSPQHLLALAASSCLMTTLLTLAADEGVPVEGYVSSVRLRERPGGPPELAIAPCVVVSSDADSKRIGPLWREAVDRSPTLRLLGSHLQVEPEVRVIPPAPQSDG